MRERAGILLRLLTGSRWATARREAGKPAPIRWPEDESQQRHLVDLHLRGLPGRLCFFKAGQPFEQDVRRVALGAYCPDTAGGVTWCGVDFDAAGDHGNGLADPVAAVRYLASAADAAGLLSGLLAVTSRRGRGRWAFLFLPQSALLADAVAGWSALVARAYALGDADVADWGGPHPFRTACGTVAPPGTSGALEIIPKSTRRPEYGWHAVLPFAGAYAAHGGGLPRDPFTDEPAEPTSMPTADSDHWATQVAEAHAVIARLPRRRVQPRRMDVRGNRSPRARTREFLDGRMPEGQRHLACFAAACDLLESGYSADNARDLILAGAERCGLPAREAGAAFNGARRRVWGAT